MNNYDYPLGSDTLNAPWNQTDNPEKIIEVLVSVTLSKTMKIKVSDYIITNSGKDEDGNYFEDIDYSNCNLKKAVEEQHVLPQEAYKYIDRAIAENLMLKDLDKYWNVDDFEVIPDSI